MDELAESAVLVADGKGGHQRMVPLHPYVMGLLEALPLPVAGPVFRRRDGLSGHPPPHLISQWANRHLHSVGIPDTLHSLRHRFATQIYRTTQDIRLTQELCGHQSPATTALYAAADMQKAAAAVFALATPA